MTAHPWRAQRATSLALVLVVAKIAGAWGRDLPASLWLAPALFWDDAAAGILFWLIDRAAGRPRWMWVTYGALVTWAALNVPIAWMLSSPMTWSMIRGARGPLADSVRDQLTATNVAAVLALLGLAFVLPSILARTTRAVRAGLVALALVVLVTAPLGASRFDLEGVQRNALTTLITTWRPRVAAVARDVDWRRSPFAGGDVQDLTALGGAAHGMNVVLVVLESTAARYLRSYGAADDPTPNFTALAARSLQFDRAYTVYPESIKGLFATLCSRDPAFDVPVEVLARARCASVVRTLASHGYRTGLFHSGRFAYLGMDAVIAAHGFDVAADAGTIGGQVESSFGVDEASTVARMLAWVDGVGDAPFFLTYLPVAGHHPYATGRPGPFQGDSELSAYRNALHEGDAALGALVDGLRSRGVQDKTLVVVYGDHGEAFGQHDGNFGHTMFIYDENVRVPLTFAIPGRPASVGRVANVASTVDIGPTILDLLGIPAVAAHEGVSLVDAASRLALFYTDYSLPLAGLQDGCWKYILQIDRGSSKLFDTCTDPDERRDLSTREPVRRDAYRQRVLAWVEARRAGMSGAPF